MKWFSLIFMVLLVGCVEVGSTRSVLTAVNPRTETPGLVEPLPSPTEASLQLGVDSTKIISQEITLTPSMTSTPEQIDIKICSPLSEHVLENLIQIISSPYDPPPMGKDDRHQGVDFAYYNHDGRESILGEGIQAILPGWVAAVLQNQLPYGNMVILETPFSLMPLSLQERLKVAETESLYHLYAHMETSPDFLLGSWVDCGDYLGSVGRTGYNIPVAHLHLETRIGPRGWRFNGMAYYDTQATALERQNYEIWRMSGLFQHFDPILLFELVDHLK